jgi:ParB-like chromosome segregation protein Spo0J
MAFKTATVDPTTLKQHPKNPRKGNTAIIEESIRKNGFFGAVVVDKRTGYILAGNHRVQAAISLKMKAIPVAYVKTKDESHALRILLSDNRVADTASYDDEALSELMMSLFEETESVEGTGYSVAEFDAMSQSSEPFGLEAFGIDPLAEGAFVPPAEAGRASGIRMVQLQFTKETHNEFRELTQTLAHEYKTDNHTDTVKKALKNENDKGKAS